MDGIHDLGGREGFGAVDVAPPLFEHDWERRAMAMTMGSFLLGHNNGGMFRHSIERMAPVHYLTTRYYEHWFTGTATRLVEAGMIDLDELEARAGGTVPLSRPVAAEPGEQPPAPSVEPAVGDRVRVRQWHPRGHSRCPWYVKGKVGTVVRLDPPASLPDLEAHADDRRNETQACVRFDGTELWGPTADAGAAIHVDLWVSYLEAEDR
jgi:nitrile hydratase